MDENVRGCPDHATRRKIFKDIRGEFIGCFSSFLGVHNALYEKIMAKVLVLNILGLVTIEKYG